MWTLIVKRQFITITDSFKQEPYELLIHPHEGSVNDNKCSVKFFKLTIYILYYGTCIYGVMSFNKSWNNSREWVINAGESDAVNTKEAQVS